MINGLTPDVAAKLDQVARRALERVASEADERLFEIVKGLEISIGTDWTAEGVTMTYKFPRDLFADATSLRKAIDARTREARLLGFGVLGEIEPDAAAPLFAETLWLNHENAYAVAYEANLIRNFWAKWKTWMDMLPPSTAAELWMAGKFRFEELSDEQIAAVPADEIHAAVPKLDADDLPRVLDLHPALRSDDTRLQLFEHAMAAKKLHTARELARILVAGKHAKSAEIARAYLDATSDQDGSAVDLVIAARDTVSLERLFAGLEARSQRKLAWDPHHVDAGLRPAIRAGFALGAADAAARFAPWFEGVRSDTRAKIAHDIWMLGTGTAVHHDGTHLATGDGDVLDQDPGWLVHFARWVNHPRLGRSAKSLLNRADKAKRKELITLHAKPAPPEKPAPKRKPAAKKSKKR